MAFGRGNQTTPWQGVHFFTNTVLQKSLKHNVVMKVQINTIGKNYTLWEKKTHLAVIKYI